MKKGMNKKGAMTWDTVIYLLLILVVVVVVILWGTGVINFSGDFWSNLAGGNKVNVQNAISGCNVACSSDLQSDFCDRLRPVIFEVKGAKQEVTCADLINRGYNLSDDCKKMSCTPISCAILSARLCDSSSICETGWVTKAIYDTNFKAQVGTGKTYKEVRDVTSKVRDYSDRPAVDSLCVFSIKN